MYLHAYIHILAQSIYIIISNTILFRLLSMETNIANYSYKNGKELSRKVNRLPLLLTTFTLVLVSYSYVLYIATLLGKL